MHARTRKTVGDVLRGSLADEPVVKHMMERVAEHPHWCTLLEMDTVIASDSDTRHELAQRLFDSSFLDAVYVEALLMKVGRVVDEMKTRLRFEVTVPGAGTFPLATKYESTAAAAAAVCTALNADVAALYADEDAEPWSDSPLLLPRFRALIDDDGWSSDADLAQRLCGARLLQYRFLECCGEYDADQHTERNMVNAGTFVIVESADAVGCVFQRACDAKLPRYWELHAVMVRETTHGVLNPTSGVQTAFAIDVGPSPACSLPLWLQAKGSKHQSKWCFDAKGTQTLLFETRAAATRARAFYRLASLVASDVYEIAEEYQVS